MSTKTALSPEEMKALVKDSIQVWNDGNLEPLEQIFAANYRNHDNGTDKAALRESIVATRQAFPDLHVSIADQMVDGDKVVTRWTGRGTHQGNHYGVAGTGKKMKNTGIGIDRIVDGKIVESWGNSDELGMFRQLGLVP